MKGIQIIWASTSKTGYKMMNCMRLKKCVWVWLGVCMGKHTAICFTNPVSTLIGLQKTVVSTWRAGWRAVTHRSLYDALLTWFQYGAANRRFTPEMGRNAIPLAMEFRSEETGPGRDSV